MAIPSKITFNKLTYREKSCIISLKEVYTMIVYKITNTVNGKVYIGATKRRLKDRWNDHCKRAKKFSDRKLYKAINECGEDNFTIEQIVEVDSFDDLYRIEAENIKLYDSVQNGYNTLSEAPQIEDWEEFYSEFKAVMQTDCVRQKISQSMKAYRQEHRFTDIHRQRISKSAIGNKNGRGNKSHSIACYCIVDGNKYSFNNYKEAGLWWYNTYHPFGDVYSSATYQRKIIDCIENGYCVYRDKHTHKDTIIVSSVIRWYRV